jgi:hypothetical protein
VDGKETYDLSHFFHGHRLEVGSEFAIEGNEQGGNSLRCIVEAVRKEPDSPGAESSGSPLDPYSKIFATMKSMLPRRNFIVPLTSFGGLAADPPFVYATRDEEETARVEFIPSDGVTDKILRHLWDRVVATPEEDTAVEALRIIEPDIQRIAFRTGIDRSFRDPATPPRSVVVRLKGTDQPLPLGSVGDGMRRLLGLALSLAQSAGGCLLVDEIDTGLHYTVLRNMWKMVIETAKRLDTQVFATTHSQDCLDGLATLQNESPELCEAVRVHRIDRELGKAVTYPASEIRIARKHHVEVR